MNRTVAIIIAVLVLASAGWWGWSRPDLLPGGPAPEIAPTRPPARPPAPPETPPAVAAMPDAVPEAVAPQPTPAPKDAALPPETGSAMARETEAVAEAAIATADARARAEETARAERRAIEAVQAELRARLTPFLTPASFSAGAIRDALAAPPAAENVAAGQARARLEAEVIAILAEADAAAREVASGAAMALHETGQPAGETAPSGDGPPTGDAPPAATPAPSSAAPFDPAPFITRIKQLL